MNTTNLRTNRLLSVAFAALLTLGTMLGVDQLAGSADVAPQWAQATAVQASVKG